MVDNIELKKGEKYLLVVDRNGTSREVLYRGRLEDALASVGWIHQFIARSFFDPQEGIILYRMKENGFILRGNNLIPIPESSGRFFYTQCGNPRTDILGIDHPSLEERKSYLKELEGVGI
jgi:hypothetical protein